MKTTNQITDRLMNAARNVSASRGIPLRTHVAAQPARPMIIPAPEEVFDDQMREIIERMTEASNGFAPRV